MSACPPCFATASLASYNRRVRISAVLFVMISLAACNRGGLQSNDAVRQGVLDHLADSQAKTSLNLAGMDVEIKSVQYNGNEADAAVSITP